MLIKKLTSFWGGGVERMLKTQRNQNKKLVKFLLTSPATRLTRFPAIPKAVVPKPVIPRAKSLALPLPSTIKPPRRENIATAPGKWLKFHHPITVLESGRPGARMNYWLYLPDKETTSPLPLVVMLHGCAQTATQFAQSTRMNQLAEKKGFAVLYPQQVAAHNTGRCWRWYNKEIQDGDGEAKIVVGLINSVLEKYALDKSRVYIAGISAGAAMANIIALNYPHLIAAVGMHSGSVFGMAETPMEGYTVMQQGAAYGLHAPVRAAASRAVHFPAMPAILIHGQDDKIVRPVNLAHLAEQFREVNHLAGVSRASMLVKITDKLANARSGNAYKAYQYYAGKKMLLKVCEISGLGHAWSGGDDSVSFSDGNGPDASKMMWEFFARHSRASGKSAVSPVATYTNRTTANL